MTNAHIAASDTVFFHSWSLIARGSGDAGLLHDEGGILIAAAGAPQAWVNSVFVKTPLSDPKAQLARAIARLDERKMTFFVRIRDGLDPASERALEALGLQYHDSVPGMVLDPVPPRGGRDAPLDIVRVEGTRRWADFVNVTMQAFGYAPEQGPQLLPPRLLHEPGTQWFVGYAGGKPAAASQLEVIGDIAGVNFIGTLEAHRGRGFGEAVTWRVVRAGAQAGCRLAVLQASDMGRPVYERMGFRTVCEYKTFARPDALG